MTPAIAMITSCYVKVMLNDTPYRMAIRSWYCDFKPDFRKSWKPQPCSAPDLRIRTTPWCSRTGRVPPWTVRSWTSFVRVMADAGHTNRALRVPVHGEATGGWQETWARSTKGVARGLARGHCELRSQPSGHRWEVVGRANGEHGLPKRRRWRVSCVWVNPFHPPGKPERTRIDHLKDLTRPALIVQGTRDPFGGPTEVGSYPLPSNIEMRWMEDGEHSFIPRKKSGRTESQNLSSAVDSMLAFVLSLD